MKILSIGNSFSQDAHRWLKAIAASDCYNLETVNLYIGGCSLEQHWNNVLENKSDYDLERNGGGAEGRISVLDALALDRFDVITLQQASHYSGMPQTYIPYLTNLADFVREKQPDAKIYFHKTWSYEIDSSHEGFKKYNNDQKEMYRRICDSVQMAAKLINAPVIPVGDVIQNIRENEPLFDYKNGGLSLCRDGFHLSLNYGRFTAATVWYKALTGRLPNINSFLNTEKETDFEKEKLKAIIKFVDEM